MTVFLSFILASDNFRSETSKPTNYDCYVHFFWILLPLFHATLFSFLSRALLVFSPQIIHILWISHACKQFELAHLFSVYLMNVISLSRKWTYDGRLAEENQYLRVYLCHNSFVLKQKKIGDIFYIYVYDVHSARSRYELISTMKIEISSIHNESWGLRQLCDHRKENRWKFLAFVR